MSEADLRTLFGQIDNEKRGQVTLSAFRSALKGKADPTAASKASIKSFFPKTVDVQWRLVSFRPGPRFMAEGMRSRMSLMAATFVGVALLPASYFVSQFSRRLEAADRSFWKKAFDTLQVRLEEHAPTASGSRPGSLDGRGGSDRSDSSDSESGENGQQQRRSRRRSHSPWSWMRKRVPSKVKREVAMPEMRQVSRLELKVQYEERGEVLDTMPVLSMQLLNTVHYSLPRGRGSAGA